MEEVSKARMSESACVWVGGFTFLAFVGLVSVEGVDLEAGLKDKVSLNTFYPRPFCIYRRPPGYQDPPAKRMPDGR